MGDRMTDFERLKARSRTTAELRRLSAATDVIEKKHLESKVQAALSSIGAKTLANKIARCTRGRVCSSVYCRKCRNTAVGRFEKRLLNRLQVTLKRVNDDRRRRSSLYDEGYLDQWMYLTVLCDVVDFKLKSVNRAVDDARSVLNRFQKKFERAWVHGAFEFELVDLDDLRAMEGDASVKKQTLLAMMDNDLVRFRGKKILVHYHAVVDRTDHDVPEMRKWFSGNYDKHQRQVELKFTRSDQAASTKIWKLASYGFKNRLQYNTSFETRGYETGAFFANKDAGRLIKLYQDFNGLSSIKRLLISIGK
jgi:hypothetical protein